MANRRLQQFESWFTPDPIVQSILRYRCGEIPFTHEFAIFILSIKFVNGFLEIK
jgi:hypothetical protein